MIKNYQIKDSEDKYGFSYNRTRKSLGIPIIPNNWHIKEREPEFIWWIGEENVIGHKRKSVIFSGGDIEGELDVYNLPLKDRKQRLIEIEYKYSKKHHIDSVSYTYKLIIPLLWYQSFL